MDTLSHTLFGLSLTALRRPGAGPDEPVTARAVRWTSVLGANLPDIDVVLLPGDPVNQIVYHRGITHSLPAAVVFAGLLTVFARWRWPRARSRAVFGWSLVSVLVGHLFADLITSFGTRILLPWDNTFYALDWIALMEPLIVLPLLLGALLAWRRPAAARRWLGAGLGAAMLFIGYRGVTHEVLLRRVVRTYAASGPVLSASMQPTYWRLDRYEYVVETPEAFRLGAVRPFGTPSEYAVYYKPLRDDPVVRAAEADPALGPILRFARHPLLTYVPGPDGYLVHITDFRGGFAFRFRLRLVPRAVAATAAGG